MKENVSILLSGIGGYGSNYVNSLLDYKGALKVSIAGIVDPKPENSSRFNELVERGIPVFSSVEEFYEKGLSADLAVISSPIQYHCEQVCAALSNGSNVLCEKPVASTLQEAEKMIRERDKSGKLLAIGYQWSFSDAVLNLKKDILSGSFGRPVKFKTIVLWPRNYGYYSRPWAAKIKDKDGRWVLDSIAHNATAHYIHNMFFVLGDNMDTSAWPLRVKAEVYKANDIENFDTAVLRIVTRENVELMYYGTHATKDRLDPVFQYEFENAVVKFDGNGERCIEAVFKDGTVKKYGNPYDNEVGKLWAMIDAVKNGKRNVYCPVEAAMPELKYINAIQDSVHEIPGFPEELVVEDDDLSGGMKGVYVKGLSTILKECYEGEKMPSELGVSWAKVGCDKDLTEYDEFLGW